MELGTNDMICCANGSAAVLVIPTTGERVEIGPGKCMTLEEACAKQGKRIDSVVALAANHYQRSSRPMGSDGSSGITHPANDSNVWPSNTTVHWIPTPQFGKCSLRLRQGATDIILLDEMDAARGSVEVAGLAAQLGKTRIANRFQLVLVSASGKEMSSTFSVLNSAQIQNLTSNLRTADSSTTDVELRWLAKAGAFADFKMKFEYAEALEKAARINLNRILLSRAINAYQEIGHLTKMDELSRLAP
jgi:hypothetical protein